MEKKNMNSILQDALEEKIPSNEIDLLPAIRASLVSGKHKQGEKMNTKPSRKISRIIFAVGLLITALMTTPQGRAFAQSILQFFTRAESNTFPLEPSQIATNESDPSAPTAVPPSPLISVTEAEVLAGFDLAELPTVPEGFEYLGARIYGMSVSIEYAVPGGGGNLILMQSQGGFLQSDWDQVPAEAIVPVQIGEVYAEFTQGMFVVMAGESSATWNSSVPTLRLRWLKDGIWFELTKFGDVAAIEYLDQAEMIELASRITTRPFPLSMEEVKNHAEFEVLQPVALPEGMSFLGASVDPVSKMISLSIGYSEGERIILIKQQRVGSQEACDLCGVVGPDASVQPVQIGDAPGEYAEGVWELNDNEAIWRDDPYLKTIRWQKDGMAFELIYMGMELGREDLIALAASMK